MPVGPAALFIVNGVLAVAVIAWLFRGYGLILVLGALSTVWSSRAGKMSQLARTYPPRRWWVLVVSLLCFQALLALVIALVNREV